MPTIAAACYTYSIGRPQRLPEQQSRFQRQLPANDVRACPARSMWSTRCWPRPGLHLILHADHEQNAFDLDRAACGFVRRQPVRVHRRRYRLAVGPAHGGANEAVLKMLMEIGTVENIPKRWRAPRTRATRSG